MPQTTAILRPDLGALAYEYSKNAAQQGFIGRIVMPEFPTLLQSAQYPVIPAEAILEVADTARAPRAAYTRGDYEFDTATYNCRENGYEEPLDDTEAALYRRYFDAEEVATMRATMMVLRSQEMRVAKAVMDTNKIPNAAAANKWDDYENADPLADVNKAKDAMRFSVGLEPNALVLDRSTYRHVCMCNAVMERVKYTSPNALRGELTTQQLAAYFGVENVIVSGSVYNAALKGKGKTVKAIWPGDKVLLARISTGGADLREPCLGRTFVWEEDSGALTTETYREEQTRASIYRVRQSTDECLQFAGAGYILTGVTA